MAVLSLAKFIGGSMDGREVEVRQPCWTYIGYTFSPGTAKQMAEVGLMECEVQIGWEDVYQRRVVNGESEYHWQERRPHIISPWR